MNYYSTNFAMMQHHNYSLSEIDNLMPWEKEVYVEMLKEFLKEENRKQEEANRKRKN